MAQDPTYDRTRDHFVRAVGLGRGTLWTFGTIALLSTAAAIGSGLVAWNEMAHSRDRIERYVVYLDDKSLPVAQARVGQDWRPQDGAYVDFSQRWIRYLRSRPLDVGVLKFQRAEVIKSTEQQVYAALQESMKAADDQVRNAAIDVQGISANLVERRDDDTAVVLVRWTEKVRSANAKPRTWTGTLTVAYQPPVARREFERNPLGLYVTNFQITEEAA